LSTVGVAAIEPAAARRPSPRRHVRLSVEPRAELTPVTAAELLGSPAARDVPADRPLAEDLRLLPLIRELPVIWEARLPPGLSPERLEVTWAHAASGQGGALLGPSSAGDALIPLSVQPTAPRVVGHEEGATVVQGGALLRLDLGSVRHSGRYRTTLEVTLHSR
jgi:hypothetical protein